MRGAVVLVAACAVACSSDSKPAPTGEAKPTTASEPGIILDPEGQPPRPDPTDPPVITYGEGGGASGRYSGYRIWANGQVRFSGSSCKGPTTGTLPPERVAKLLDELESKGWLVAPEPLEPLPLGEGKMGKGRGSGCSDCVSSHVSATRGDKVMSFEHEQNGSSKPPDGMYAAMGVIGRVLGHHNPC